MSRKKQTKKEERIRNQEQFKEIGSRLKEIRKDEPREIKEHLTTFNDGVIAIIITIIVLQVPFPGQAGARYQEFIKILFIYFISFFLVAYAWYEHHRSFQLIKKADKTVVLLNFIYLAILSVVPIMTKWIIQDHSRLAVFNMGVVIFFIDLVELMLYRKGFKEMFGEKEDVFYFSNRIIVMRIWGRLLWTLALALLALKYPSVAMVCYISIPLLTFFLPITDH